MSQTTVSHSVVAPLVTRQRWLQRASAETIASALRLIGERQLAAPTPAVTERENTVGQPDSASACHVADGSQV